MLDQVLTRLVGRMGLAGEQELDGTLGVVHDLVQTVEVAEQERSPLVGGETPGEADGEDIVPEGVQDGHQFGRRIVVGDALVLQTRADEGDQLLLQVALDLPDLLVGNLVDSLEALLVIVVGLEFLAEHPRVDGLPLRGAPGRIVDAVGYIANEQFLRQIARVHVREDVLAHLAVKMLAARLDIENFSFGSRALSLPRDIRVSQSTFRRSG